VSDRALRDEIEQLSAQLREARKKLELSSTLSAGVERVRTLRKQVEAARQKRDALKDQVRAAEARVDTNTRERSQLKEQLARARARIAELDPQPSSWEREPAAWEVRQGGGCLSTLLAVAGLFW
jgi:chromosome segregation ATPase